MVVIFSVVAVVVAVFVVVIFGGGRDDHNALRPSFILMSGFAMLMTFLGVWCVGMS